MALHVPTLGRPITGRMLAAPCLCKYRHFTRRVYGRGAPPLGNHRPATRSILAS
ncbi:MAG: hypothetical protein HDS16_09060, partial [Bacteroides sp.]|nr:hypothetical protein [Bacteroides sp.]